MHLPKEKQAQRSSPEGLRQAIVDHMREQPSLYNNLFKAQEVLRKSAPAEVPRMGRVSEEFNIEYQSIRKDIWSLELDLALNKNITSEQKERGEKKLDTLKAKKKALEEEGNKKDEAFVRSFIRFGTGTGVFLSSLPLVGPVGATAAGIGAVHLAKENEFEIVKQALFFGAAGKVFGKLRKIPIINQAEGKVVAWVRNLSKPGGATKIPGTTVKLPISYIRAQKVFGKDVKKIVTRQRNNGKGRAYNIEFEDGTKIDINPDRVKMDVPKPQNPSPGGMGKHDFVKDGGLPEGTKVVVKGTKTLPHKRTLTEEEMKLLEDLIE